MSEANADGTDAKSRARIVAGLEKMIASGRMTVQEADRIRAAADPRDFDAAVQAVRVRHAGAQVGAAIEDGRLTRDEADDILQRLRNGEHSSSLRARLRSHAPRMRPRSRPPVSATPGGDAVDTPGGMAPP